MNDLKRDIAANRYAIDADAVAAAIVSKLEMIRLGREALLSEARRNPPPRPAPRRDP